VFKPFIVTHVKAEEYGRVLVGPDKDHSMTELFVLSSSDSN
jgi:hypothetical protein